MTSTSTIATKLPGDVSAARKEPARAPEPIAGVEESGPSVCKVPGMQVRQGTVGADAVDIVVYDVDCSDELVRRDAVVSQRLEAHKSEHLDHCSFGLAPQHRQHRHWGIRVAADSTLRSIVSAEGPEEAASAILFAVEAAAEALSAMHSQGLVAGGMSAWSMAARRGRRWSWFFRWTSLARAVDGDDVALERGSVDELYDQLRIPKPTWRHSAVVPSAGGKQHDWYCLGVCVAQAVISVAAGDTGPFERFDPEWLSSVCSSVGIAVPGPTRRMLRALASLACALLSRVAEPSKIVQEILGKSVELSVMQSGMEPFTVSARTSDSMAALHRRILRRLWRTVGSGYGADSVSLTGSGSVHPPATATVGELISLGVSKQHLVVDLALPLADTRQKVVVGGPREAGMGDFAASLTATNAVGCRGSAMSVIAHATQEMTLRFPAATVMIARNDRPGQTWDVFSGGTFDDSHVHLVFRQSATPLIGRVVAAARQVVSCDGHDSLCLLSAKVAIDGMISRQVVVPVALTQRASEVMQLSAYLPLHPRLVAPAILLVDDEGHGVGVGFVPIEGVAPPAERRDIGDALEHLHTHGIAHGDVANCVSRKHGVLVVSPAKICRATPEAVSRDKQALNLAFR